MNDGTTDTTEKAVVVVMPRDKVIQKSKELIGNLAHSANILVPAAAFDQMPVQYQPALVQVMTPSLAPDDGWAYPIPGGRGKMGLAKPMLLKLAGAAGLSVVFNESMRLDDCADSSYCRYRVVMLGKNFDGTPRKMQAEKEVDLRDGSPQCEELHRIARAAANKARAAGNKPYREDASDQIQQQRLHIQSLAETKAMLRCVRAMLGMKTSYTRQELALPFVVCKMQWIPPKDDVVINRMIAASELGMTDALFGSGGGQQTGSARGFAALDVAAQEPAPALPAGDAAPVTEPVVDPSTLPAEDLPPEPGEDKPFDVPDGGPPVDDAPPVGGQQAPDTVQDPKKGPAKKPTVGTCECGCGCQAGVTAGDVKASADHGIRLCPECNPDSSAFDADRHPED